MDSVPVAFPGQVDQLAPGNQAAYRQRGRDGAGDRQGEGLVGGLLQGVGHAGRCRSAPTDHIIAIGIPQWQLRGAGDARNPNLAVVGASLPGAVGKAGVSGAIVGLVTALAGWFIWAFLVYIIGTKLLPEKETSSDMGELLRTIGFSSAPGLVRVFGLIPGLTGIVFFVKLYSRTNNAGSARKALAVICSGSEKLLEDAYAGKPLPEPRCKTTVVEETFRLAEKLGIRGTPTMILPDGRVARGYRDADAITALLEAGKAAAGGAGK